MQMTSLRTCHFQRIVDLVSRPECHGARGILPRLALLLMIPAAIASPLPWGPAEHPADGDQVIGAQLRGAVAERGHLSDQKSSRTVPVSYTHLTLPTNREM